MAVLEGARFLMSEAPLYSFKEDDAAWGATADHPYRGTSLIRNTPLLGPYRRTI